MLVLLNAYNCSILRECRWSRKKVFELWRLLIFTHVQLMPILYNAPEYLY